MNKKSIKKIPLLRRFDIRHPFVIPFMTLLVLFSLGATVFVFAGGKTVGADDSHLVKLHIDGKQRTIPTRAKTVAEMLEKLNIQLSPQDAVEPARAAEIESDNFTVNVYRARPVTIIDNGRTITTLSAAQEPKSVASSAGIALYPEDLIAEEKVTSSSEPTLGSKLVIDRAATVNINLYGNAIISRTRVKTVGQLLADKNIVLREGDTLQPSPETVLANDTQVFVVSNGKKISTEDLAIASPIETTDDYEATLGSTKIIDPGVSGKKVVTYEITLANGRESSRRVIQEVVVSPPTPRKVAKGKKAPIVAGNKAEIMAAAGISAEEYYAVDYIISRESGWRVNALNAAGCAGLGQACPASKLERACPSWQSDPVCQIGFFSGYAVGRYGSWTNAYNRWQVQGYW